MPLINFKKQFVEMIINHKKRQTIRKVRKRAIKRGDTLYLYTGVRTKNCKFLLRTICSDTFPIEINRYAIIIHKDYFTSSRISTEHELNEFARQDGFDSFLAMLNFFKEEYELPFHGILIKW